jgi:hypothetical protein
MRCSRGELRDEFCDVREPVRFPHALRTFARRCFCGAVVRLAGVALLILWLGNPAPAAEQVEGFEGPDPSWSVRFAKSDARVLSHRRHRKIFQGGQASENIEFEGFADTTEIQLEHPLTPARLIDELKASLWVRSNRANLRLTVRVVLPFQKTAGRDGTLRVLVDGDSYTTPDSWQELTCRDIEAELRKQLPRIRLQAQGTAANGGTGRDLDLRGMYVDQILLRGRVGRGTAEFFLDDLKFGPIVSISGGAGAGPVAQVAHDESRPQREIEQRLDRLVLQGRPLFPRLVASHGESADELAAMRFNLVWIPNYEDEAALATLKQHGLRAVATPLRPRSETGEPLAPSEANLAPFTSASDGVALWMLGSEIPSSRYEEAVAWTEQIRNADRRMGRPVTADILGREQSFSRELTTLGVSRRVIGTSFSLRNYRDWLIERRNTAQPGTLLWTTVQTEPRLPTFEGSVRAPFVVEPELIRLQVYAALAAGYRGLCYWTDLPLGAADPESRERSLQITQLNMEIELLEPWLATGKLQTQTPFSASPPKTGNFSQLNTDFGVSDAAARRRAELLEEKDDYGRRMGLMGRELEAASLATDYGQLLLPVWYGDQSQFVPDVLAANDATIVIPGATESASVYEVSTTEIRNIAPPRKQRVAGGLKITLEKFDQTSAVVLSEDRALIDRLRAKMASMRPRSAEVSLELARLKLDRVIAVDASLQRLGRPQADGPRLLASARLCLDQGRALFAKQQYHEARLLANNAMQLARILQRAHWNDAVRAMKGAPIVTSPYLTFFQTLPEHWELMERFGQASGVGQALLPGGHFEDFDRLVAEGLTHQQTEIDGVRATAEHYPKGHAGRYALKLAAGPERGRETPRVVSETPVQIRTGPVPVAPGQVIHISFWLRIPNKIVSNLDGVVVYDSIGGPEQALRLNGPIAGWTQYQLLREVREASDLTITVALAGLGEVLIDDVSITAFGPQIRAEPLVRAPTLGPISEQFPPRRMTSNRVIAPGAADNSPGDSNAGRPVTPARPTSSPRVIDTVPQGASPRDPRAPAQTPRPPGNDTPPKGASGLQPPTTGGFTPLRPTGR